VSKYDPERGVRWFCYGCTFIALAIMLAGALAVLWMIGEIV